MKKLISMAAAIISSAALAQASAPAPAASAASAPYELAITPNTACGAPGVGWRGVISGGTQRREAKQEDGQRVNAKGRWEPCTMPARKDCPVRKAPSWLVDGYLCQPTQGRLIPGRDAPFRHDVKSDPALRNEGIQYWSCERSADGTTAWKSERAICRPKAR